MIKADEISHPHAVGGGETAPLVVTMPDRAEPDNRGELVKQLCRIGAIAENRSGYWERFTERLEADRLSEPPGVMEVDTEASFGRRSERKLAAGRVRS